MKTFNIYSLAGAVEPIDSGSLTESARLFRGVQLNQSVCYVGSHEADITIPLDSLEYVHWCDNTHTGFIIRPEAQTVDGLPTLDQYKVEEWVEGDIVDQDYCEDYQGARSWINREQASHCNRRYTLNQLCDLWNRLGDVPVDEDDHTEEAFLFFPVGVHREDIWHWFESANPSFLVGEAGSYIDGSHKYRTE